MTKPVRTTLDADLQAVEIDLWWRQNRDKAPDLFEQELANALRTIASAPHVGKRIAHPQEPELRRVVLRSTRHHVYYVEREDYLLVVAVWGAIKGVGPDLSALDREDEQGAR